ncbi:MAG: peptidylprolyl isomerase [Planctomycetales bacterium]|nr:peptidylprolyl isomerase [Planctomycetales bacterium]
MRHLLWILLGILSFAGCGGVQTKSASVYREGLTTPSGEPAYITVQHCLIGFSGSVPGKQIHRTKEEAEQLAQEILAQAEAGEDFEGLIRRHTDDAPPGIYKMANEGFPGDMTSRVQSNFVFARNEMVAAFGDTGFPLEVGEYGLATYDPVKSPFGWHIVKRIK